MSRQLTIGRIAQAAGVSADTIRYYERLKLIPRPARTRAGYRTYSNEDIEKVRFIKQAQTLGLSLEEIKQLLPEHGAGLSECKRVRDLLSAKLEELTARLAEMRMFQRTLVGYLKECEAALAGKRGDCCPVLFQISHTADRNKRTPRRFGSRPKEK
jgi:DNA-binding transcriptional MerR regulator